MNRGSVILFYPAYEGTGSYHWFPFPYLYIGPFLEKEGFNPIIIDARVRSDWRGLLKDGLKDAPCLGITAMTGSDIRDAIEAAAICRKRNPRTTIIWGGPHATALPDQTISSCWVDVVIRHHGEYVMIELAKRIYYEKEIDDLEGITYKKDGMIYRTGDSKIVPFDRNIFPGYHLIDVERYRSANNVVSVFTARGCPFKCTFCTTKDRGYSERTIKQVKDEISYVVERLGFKNIFFQDGTFFTRKKRTIDIARWLIESGLNIKWKAKARANSIINYTKEELSLLKRSGLLSVFFGIESGSPGILRGMNKNTNTDDAEKSATVCRDYDIEFYTSFMYAMPYETIRDLRETISHIRRLKKINPNIIVQNCIYLPLPATLMFEEAQVCGYTPPSMLEGWIERGISSRFEERDDITWIPPHILKEYIKIYNEEFGYYKHLYEKEKNGEYESVFRD